MSNGLRQLITRHADLNNSLGMVILSSFDISTVQHLAQMDAVHMACMMQMVDSLSVLLRWRPERLSTAIQKLVDTAVEDTKKFAAGMEHDSARASALLIQQFPTVEANAKLFVASAYASNLLDDCQLNSVLEHLAASDRLAREGIAHLEQAAEILDNVPKPARLDGVSDDEQPAFVLKRASLIVRDMFVWRCFGMSMRMDTNKSIESFLSKHNMDGLRSRLLISFDKIRRATAKSLTGSTILRKAAEDQDSEAEEMVTDLDYGPPPGLELQ